MGNWFNPDGLFVKFGTDKTVPNVGGEYRTTGKYREIEVEIDLTTLTQVEVVQSDQVNVPTTYELAQVEIWVETAAVTGTAIDVGLVRMDRTTEVDFDGILAAFVTATMTNGNYVKLVKGGTQAGALVGSGSQATAFPAYITASRTDATAFTAGKVHIKLLFVNP
jgi:hypothetical protein